jgi:ribulose-phosphate 3-epimerase
MGNQANFISHRHFVPNISIGPDVVKWVRKRCPEAILDCHLMVSNPSQWLEQFIKAGASIITFHIEAVNGTLFSLDSTRKRSTSDREDKIFERIC